MTLPKNKSIVTLSRYECGETGEPPHAGADGRSKLWCALRMKAEPP